MGARAAASVGRGSPTVRSSTRPTAAVTAASRRSRSGRPGSPPGIRRASKHRSRDRGVAPADHRADRHVQDATLTSHQRTGSRAWWLVAGLLITAFLARGPLYLCVFPPFEGWDEYQHLAYLAHLDETGMIPVFDQSRVSLTLRPLVTSVPHSEWGGDTVEEWGVLSYAEYWNSPAPRAGTDRGPTSAPRLYQAQHPPLAYLVAVPIWRATRAAHPLEAIYAIRTMNLVLVAAALVLFAGALKRLVPGPRPRVAILALVCLHPLFFQNVARV